MRGYFAVGADGISKPMNLGNLLRVIYDGRKALACQYGHEEYTDPERTPLEPARSES